MKKKKILSPKIIYLRVFLILIFNISYQNFQILKLPNNSTVRFCNKNYFEKIIAINLIILIILKENITGK